MHREWKHDVSEDWLMTRRHFLCASDIRNLIVDYRKVKSDYIIRNNSYISQGLVSPSFIYTNVNGGLGLFGSLSVSRSPWLGNPGGLADAGPYE